MVATTEERLNSFFDCFKDKKILVVGDLMLDRYVEGTVNRISPEAPVPVVEVKTEFTRMGGAANVAYNLYSLKAIPILIGIVGEDDTGKVLTGLMHNLNFPTEHLLISEQRPTVVKTRIIADDQHIVRADRESKSPIDKELAEKVINTVEKTIDQADAVIIQDYNKGLLTAGIITRVIEIAKRHQKIITVDPKFDNFFQYKSVTLFKPNRKETEQALGIRIDSVQDVENACKLLLNRLNCDSVLITLGEEGMCLVESNGDVFRVETKARKVHDVSGAGDTVISTLTLALSCGANLKEATTLANYSAGAVCGEVGVVPITPDKLKMAFQNF
ncbi:D-glycero-beta-D-manno-heptose-7-phosphate kinase [candidate division KSB1 bacterium]|nr:D-glycero-beta-D-manno-heptose-7-phosphate kinase [candidate division KSB1 bacterium]MBL7094466.1 D-glycero-beta-D-manno-heptose-7-phosphate kinase [candidate division KSB1 bacterium]